MKKNSIVKMSILGLIITAAIVLFCIWYFDIDENARFETIQQGNQIVHKLEEYFRMYQRYPQNLNEIGSIPAPKWGEKWIYECVSQGKTFRLSVGYKDYGDAYYPVMCYDPNGWIYDN